MSFFHDKNWMMQNRGNASGVPPPPPTSKDLTDDAGTNTLTDDAGTTTLTDI